MSAPNAAQVTYWNGPIGKVWAKEQAKRDRDHAPMTMAGIDLLAPKPGQRVLDIGCGSGTTTFLLAERAGPSGKAVGIDLSGPMLAVADARRKEVSVAPEFIQGDVTDYPFAPASFDCAFSQFGVMFFADSVASFAAVHRAMKKDGRLVFVCWRGANENPWSSVPESAAKPLLPPSAPVSPDAPGRYYFSDPERVNRVLSGAGFRDIALDKFDAKIHLGRTPEEAASSSIDAGPLLRTLAEVDEPTRARVREAVTARLSREMGPGGVYLTGGCWLVSARG
ncbi:MAG: methyltransferase domain-containing protein [Alphaproteobacteria bacterium]|nr:methyltransferase domain-containing protein [Alphaproteobacteria bacterium]